MRYKHIQLCILVLCIFITSWGIAQETKTSVEQQDLDYLTGKWKIQMVFHPCQWWPKGDQGEGEMVAYKTLNGNFIEMFETSKRNNGKSPYECRSLLRWEPYSQSYQLWRFDTVNSALQYQGCQEGKTLVFLSVTPSYREYRTHRMISSDQFEIVIENAIGKAPLKKIITSTFTRVKEK